jgi:hypothetical protein
MRFIFGTIFTALSCMTLWAQTGQIKGVVRDQMTNEVLPYANVVVFGTVNGTMTDSIGRFEISNISEEFVKLQISIVGYETLISEPIVVSKVRIVNMDFELIPLSEALAEVKITAPTSPQKAESPVSLQRIGIDLIEKGAGSNRDIGKVLQSFPGVGGTSSFRNDLIVRGGGPSENKFYLDGIEIPTLNHFSTQGASGGPVAILNVDFIREVDFYSGAFPSARGNALSSVFEFKQIDGNKDKAGFKGSVGASEIAMSLNTPVGKNTTLLASARRSYLQFLFNQLGLPFLPTFNDFSFKVKTNFNQQNELTVLGVGAIDQFKLNTGIENPDEETAYILGYLPVNTQWNYATGAVYKHYFSKSYMTVVLSRNFLNNKSYKYLDNIEIPENKTYDYTSTEAENKFRLEYNARPHDLAINGGVSLEWADYTNQTYNLIYQDGETVNRYYNTSLGVFKWGAFGSVAHPFFNKRLVLSGGLRVDANNYSSQMSNAIDQFSPRISASYRLTSPFTISASMGRYYQLPAYTTLGYQLNNQYVNKINGVKYIKADHYIAGVAFKPDENLKISLEGFIKLYDKYPFSVTDSVSLASKGSDFGVFGDEEVTSTSTGRTNGFELLVQQRTKGGLSYMLAYTFVRSEFSDYKGDLVASSWDSKHLLTFTMTQKLQHNWNVGMKWRYIGGLPYTPYDFEKSSMVLAWDARGREYLDYSQFNAKRLEPFHQLDIRVDKSYFFKQWTFSWYLDIQNVYNSQSNNSAKLVQVKDVNNQPIIINPGDPLAMQKYQLKELQTTSGTILPTIGIIVEF